MKRDFFTKAKHIYENYLINHWTNYNLIRKLIRKLPTNIYDYFFLTLLKYNYINEARNIL
jgi:hypothetical protein